MYSKIVLTPTGAEVYRGGEQPTFTATAAQLAAKKSDVVALGLLPPAVRWLSQDQTTFLVERPPRFISMEYYHGSMYAAKSKEHQRFAIPVPWQLYLISFSHSYQYFTVRAFVRPAALSTMADKLFVYPLPNVEPDGTACLHFEKEYPAFLAEHTPTVAECLGFAVNILWLSGFNINAQDILHHARRHPRQFLEAHPDIMRQSSYDVLTAMETHSLTEVLSWEYPPLRMSVQQLVDKYPSSSKALFDATVQKIYEASQKR